LVVLLESPAMAVVKFGVYDFDPDSGDLHRLGSRVHLTRQTSRVLALLVSRPGEVITRDELKRHMWGRETFVDFDRSLNFCIASARAALRDDARNPRFIETLPRVGYRFMAETAAIEATTRPSEIIQDPERPRVGYWLGIAAALLLAVQQPGAPFAHSRTTALPAARAAFVEAFAAPPQDATALRRSIATLKRATELDPRFAEAHFALADLYVKLAMMRELPIASALAEAEDSARRAIALEDAPETRQVLANVRLLRDWDGAGARRELERAVELAPRWDIGIAMHARVLSAIGDDAAAIATINRAETLSPTCDLILFDAGAIYARAGRFIEADQKLRRAIDMGPPHTMTLDQWRAEVQFRLLRFAVVRGRWPEAHAAAMAILDANGYGEDVRRRFASRDPREAVEAFLRRSIENMKAQATKEYIPPTRIASLFSLLDDAEHAMDWLEAAAVEHDPDLIYALRDPEFARLRGAPRFAALARRIQSPVGSASN
jgi:DNA-binding winged helix-turn-helix (wHTH) protein